jgi:3-phosphoshikimate 1-carboxyvinyltransferase
VDGGLVARGPLDAGESGTLARLATALLALAGRPGQVVTIGARGSLLFRRSTPLFDALRAAGVEIRRQNLPGTWPVELTSVQPPPALELVRPVSSQEVSGLLLALAAHPGARLLTVRGEIPSEPYLRITEHLLGLFGARVEREHGAPVQRFRVRGPLVAGGTALVLEPDASSAAVALAAACLSGGEIRVPDLSRASVQGDVRIVEHLCAFGCEAGAEEGALRARGFPRHGAELDLGGEPDLAPVLAAVAAGAALRHGATSTLRGLATLPGKESDRLSVLADGLRRLGLAVETGVDSLRVAPGAARDSGAPVELDPRGDHRMAFALALLGCLRPGVTVRDPGCVAKSWGSFWTDLAALGARVQRSPGD